MVYKHLDPARDWDAYCDDHPDPPDFSVIPEEYYQSECCKRKVYKSKNGRNICEYCGHFCRIDETESVNNYMINYEPEGDYDDETY